MKRIRLHTLQALHGDAFLIEVLEGEKSIKIIVDGGPEDTAGEISKYFESFDKIDLLVLTHYDEDHIGGILEYIYKCDINNMPIKHLYVNCAESIDFENEDTISVAGYKNAHKLAGYLRIIASKNKDFLWKEDIIQGMPVLKLDDVYINILSPDACTLNKLKGNLNDYVEHYGITDETNNETNDRISKVRVMNDAHKSLTELAASDNPRNVNLMNRSSIAFLMTVDNKNIIMGGDAAADTIADGIERLGYSPENPLHVNLFKMSHHGSQNNISFRLLELMQCKQFLFSTNGGSGSSFHPDRKTIAIVLQKARKSESEKVKLFFNYPLTTIEQRTGQLLKKKEKEQCDIQDNIQIIEI